MIKILNIVIFTKMCHRDTKTNAVENMRKKQIKHKTSISKNAISEKHFKLKLHKITYAYSQGEKRFKAKKPRIKTPGSYSMKSLSTFCL